jgi:UDP-N-acetylglucosamine:LPS N-acetylglucosamine transferase
MLPRDEARLELGLSLDKPAVLIQLGAGNNFDYRNIHKAALAQVTERHHAEVAVGDWLISDKPMVLPETVVRLPGYPFARYFNAFDLAISAVGYNSFHELVYAGVATIFVPNEAMEQDNQLARALYADRQGFAACVRAKEIYGFTDRIDRLFDPAERLRMESRLAAIEQENGAAEAAAFIEEMAFSRRIDRA